MNLTRTSAAIPPTEANAMRMPTMIFSLLCMLDFLKMKNGRMTKAQSVNAVIAACVYVKDLTTWLEMHPLSVVFLMTNSIILSGTPHWKTCMKNNTMLRTVERPIRNQTTAFCNFSTDRRR